MLGAGVEIDLQHGFSYHVIVCYGEEEMYYQIALCFVPTPSIDMGTLSEDDPRSAFYEYRIKSYPIDAVEGEITSPPPQSHRQGGDYVGISLKSLLPYMKEIAPLEYWGVVWRPVGGQHNANIDINSGFGPPRRYRAKINENR